MNADERRLVVSYSPYFYLIVFIINSLYKSGDVMKSPRAVCRGAPRLYAGEGGEAGGGEGEGAEEWIHGIFSHFEYHFYANSTSYLDSNLFLILSSKVPPISSLYSMFITFHLSFVLLLLASKYAHKGIFTRCSIITN
jgi:hypothetical protein